MGLTRYEAKRDFKRTPEPRGAPKAQARSDRFVIQKHAARRLHYDLRLELDGVLKSWAVTRGPSLVPGDKRLAVETEDHPLEYATFEGTIPKGEYGGGRVIVWDNGHWEPEGDPHQALKKGHLRFKLHGQKLSGQFDLVRMKPRERERTTNWLLLKSRDEHARSENDPDILVERPESVQSGKRIEDLPEPEAAKPRVPSRSGVGAPRKSGGATSRPDPKTFKQAEKAALPAFVEPELATLVPDAPSGPGWLHEIKLDGYRLEARINRGRVQLKTRSGLDWTSKFPVVAKLLAALDVDQALVDGEVVAETAQGASSFSELQADLSAGRNDRLVFYGFDLLYLDGYDLRGVPLAERKKALAALLPKEAGFLRFSEHFDTDGDVLKKHACRVGFEGIVSKRADAPYRSGRTQDWLKSKCADRQELVVVGYVPSTTSQRAIGSLALGAYENGRLIFVGKVGSGFSTKTAQDLWKQLEPLRSDKRTAEPLPDSDIRQVRWVEPRYVVEVEFREWTGTGHIRHAVFQGLRLDKDPKDVTREKSLPPGRPAKPAKKKGTPGPTTVRKPPIKLTHPDRIYWSDVGVSKQGLADYYMEVWDWIAPHITGRPLSLVRCPSGIDACFYQKHEWRGMDKIAIQAGRAGDDRILSISSLEGALALVQAGTIEIHPWGSTTADPEHPDRLIFDFDPGEGLPWTEVERAALDMRERLAGLGLRSFLKTTGGKGLHVVIPIEPVTDWDTAKAFTQTIAVAMTKDEPNRYVSKMTKSIRGGKIFVDYLRNGRGATAIAAYSPRARPGAPVSTPLAWEELGTGISPSHFTIANLRRRLLALDQDPWADLAKVKQKLPV